MSKNKCKCNCNETNHLKNIIRFERRRASKQLKLIRLLRRKANSDRLVHDAERSLHKTEKSIVGIVKKGDISDDEEVISTTSDDSGDQNNEDIRTINFEM